MDAQTYTCSCGGELEISKGAIIPEEREYTCKVCGREWRWEEIDGV